MDYLSLCLITKDENEFIQEWLDYHILVGVERFYIYDNESDIPLREMLGEYIETGWVVLMEIPGPKAQLYAYDHCICNFGGFSSWIGFIDADEFLVPKTTSDLNEFLKDYEDHAGLAASCLVFGSNGHMDRPPAGQAASYTQRTEGHFPENLLVKTIPQPAAILFPDSPHNFLYRPGHSCANEKGYFVEAQTFPNHVEKLQVNHYICRSAADMAEKLKHKRDGAGKQTGAFYRREQPFLNRGPHHP